MNKMKRILVCDDEKSIREALNTYLQSEGYEVGMAKDGNSALEEFKNGGYDLVFMDVRMPGIDGIECMREMKRIKPDVKVVIITGLPDEDTFDRAVSVSEDAAEGFIAKPFNPEDLRKLLKNISAGKTISRFQLTPDQLEVLAELVKSCAQNASQDFSQIIKKETQLCVEKTMVVPFSHIVKGEENQDMNVGMLIKFSGQIEGGILVCFPWDSGLALIDLLEQSPRSTTTFDQSAHKLLNTVGSILAASYLNSVNTVLGISVTPQLPELIFDEKRNIIETAGKMFALMEPFNTADYVFSVETELSIVDTDIKGYLLFIPDSDSVKMILKTGGVLE